MSERSGLEYQSILKHTCHYKLSMLISNMYSLGLKTSNKRTECVSWTENNSREYVSLQNQFYQNPSAQVQEICLPTSSGTTSAKVRDKNLEFLLKWVTVLMQPNTV